MLGACPRLAQGGAELCPLQLLKKIKRCERKGSESVTEEKCAVLFSTSVALSPGNLSIHLQVSAFSSGMPQPCPGSFM